MRCKLLACEVMHKEIDALAALLGTSPQAYDTEWFPMRLHRNPEYLRAELAKKIDALRGAPYDAILLAFGLCSNSTANLRAPGIPLVLPKMHDCVTLFLGSRQRYQDEHTREPGTYWFARGFLEQNFDNPDDLDDDADPFAAPASGSGESDGGGLPDGFFLECRREKLLAKWTEKYGEDSAEYLVELWLDSWKKNYTRAVLLADPNDPDTAGHRRQVSEYAGKNHWRYEEMPLNLRLLKGLLDGGWQTSDDYLVVPPEKTIRPTHDAEVVAAE